LWAVADNTSDAGCRANTINATGLAGRRRCILADARQVVIKDKGRGVRLILFARDARVAGAQVAVFEIAGKGRASRENRFAAPGTILSMRGDDDPLLTKRMPSFFPGHSSPVNWSYADFTSADCSGLFNRPLRGSQAEQPGRRHFRATNSRAAQILF